MAKIHSHPKELEQSFADLVDFRESHLVLPCSLLQRQHGPLGVSLALGADPLHGQLLADGAVLGGKVLADGAFAAALGPAPSSTHPRVGGEMSRGTDDTGHFRIPVW